jgi:hypothetical protein
MAQQTATVANLRAQLRFAHEWLEGTLAGVDDALANEVPPGGKVASIGAMYGHVVMGEDYFVNVLLRGAAPIMAGGSTGVSEPPPPGSWGEWGRSVHTDIAALHAYAQQVYMATDAYLSGVTDAELARMVETPVGTMPLGAFIGLWILNAHCHTGEISALKGLKGRQGYPA